MEDTKKCPYCGEEIKAVAKKCRFCGQWLVEKDIITNEHLESPKSSEQNSDTKVLDNPQTTTTEAKGLSDTTISKNSDKKYIWIVAAFFALVCIIPLVKNCKIESKSREEEKVRTISDDKADDMRAKAIVKLREVQQVDEALQEEISRRIKVIYTDVFKYLGRTGYDIEKKYFTEDLYAIFSKAREIGEKYNEAPLQHNFWIQQSEWKSLSYQISSINNDAYITTDNDVVTNEGVIEVGMDIQDTNTDHYPNTVTHTHYVLKMKKEKGNWMVDDLRSLTNSSEKTVLVKYIESEHGVNNDIVEEVEGVKESDLVRLFAEEVGISPIESGILSNSEYINRFSKLIGNTNYSKLKSNRAAYSLTVRYDDKGKYGFQILDKDDQIVYYVIYDTVKDNMTVFFTNNSISDESGQYRQEKVDRSLIEKFSDSPFYN